MNAIAEELALGKYDIVCLQEVWSENDYIDIKKLTLRVLPYSHYFYSGVFGSGVCIFSRYTIENVFFHQWPLNGYVHKLHHGDWFGGKGIGLCRVKCKGININIYSAHIIFIKIFIPTGKYTCAQDSPFLKPRIFQLHAEYNRRNDEYMAHRVLQAFDMSQFISITSTNADIVILGGDLNTEPGDLAYRIICHNAQVQDSFLQAQQVSVDYVGTNESSRNSYSDKKLCMKKPAGNRIDYIMYKCRRGIEVQCLKYQFPLPERVPKQNFSFSDHEALQVSFRVIRTSNGKYFAFTLKCSSCKVHIPDSVFLFQASEDALENKEEYMKALKESRAVCDAALGRLHQDKRSYWIYSAAFFLTLLCTIGLEAPLSCFKTYNIIRVVVTILLCFTIFMATIWNRMEVNAILTGKLGIEVVHSNLEDCNSDER
ncbi:putative neutral sphingomyelinase [Cryptotermes secundus]|uniref:sphingomyelin phosphodiesterase n=1 Tax=Cryptotermes secundus TaxID=105785 RepID=A0A2J7RG53_9NEOP|nr:putative neutral sphingomyelinase [Cryptotermes secundus]